MQQFPLSKIVIPACNVKARNGAKRMEGIMNIFSSNHIHAMCANVDDFTRHKVGFVMPINVLIHSSRASCK